jgi:hypothetical protein
MTSGSVTNGSAVLRPAAQHRQPREVDLVAAPDDLLHGRARHAPGRERRQLAQLRQVRRHAEQAAAEPDVHQGAQAGGEVVQVVDAERPRHALPGAEEVDRDGQRRSPRRPRTAGPGRRASRRGPPGR